MNGTPAAKARRNLAMIAHRQMWNEAHAENHPLRYRLHYLDGTRNIKTDRLGLLAEIRETRPIMIERIIPKSEVGRLATIPEHLRALGCAKVWGVADV